MTKPLRRVRIEVPAGTYSQDRPGLLERLGKLAGATGWRQPVEGTGTSRRTVPAEHELCIALAMSRTSDPLDIGPDIAFDMATISNRHQQRVCEALAKALGNARDHRCVRRNRPFLRIAAWAAYTRLVYGETVRMPDQVRPEDWEVLTDVAERILSAMADEAVSRAARAMRKQSAA